MSVAPRLGYGPLKVRRRPGLLTWVAVGCIAAVVIEAGIVTDWFGLPALGRSSGGGGGSSGPNPNPFNETITSLVGSIVYSGNGSDPFPSLSSGAELCARCPFLPSPDDNGSTPAVSAWIYFNLTYDGANISKIANFTLTTSGANASLFTLLGVYVQGSPGEAVPQVTFWPSMSTWALILHVMAPALPYSEGGYTLTWHVTSP